MPDSNPTFSPLQSSKMLNDEHLKALDDLFFRKDIYPAPEFNKAVERYHYYRDSNFNPDTSGIILEYIAYRGDCDFNNIFLLPNLTRLAKHFEEGNDAETRPQSLRLILILNQGAHYISAVVDLLDWTYKNDQHRFSAANIHFFDSLDNKGEPGEPLETKTTAIEYWEPVLKGIFQDYIPSTGTIRTERIAVSNQTHSSNNCGIAAYINAHAYALNLPLPKKGTAYSTWRKALIHDIDEKNQKKQQETAKKQQETAKKKASPQETSSNVIQALTRLSVPISAPTQAANQPPAPQSTKQALNFNPFSSANKTRTNYKEKIRNTFECFCQEFSDDIYALDLLDYLLIFPFLTKLIINKIDNSQLTQRSKDILNSLVFIGYLITFFIPKLILSTLFTGLIGLLILPLIPNTKKASPTNHVATAPTPIPTENAPSVPHTAIRAYSQPSPASRVLGF